MLTICQPVLPARCRNVLCRRTIRAPEPRAPPRQRQPTPLNSQLSLLQPTPLKSIPTLQRTPLNSEYYSLRLSTINSAACVQLSALHSRTLKFQHYCLQLSSTMNHYSSLLSTVDPTPLITQSYYDTTVYSTAHSSQLSALQLTALNAVNTTYSSELSILRPPNTTA